MIIEDYNFNKFYNTQSDGKKRILDFVINHIRVNGTYKAPKKLYATTKYRLKKISHYLNDIDGTLLIDLLVRDISKLYWLYL